MKIHFTQVILLVSVFFFFSCSNGSDKTGEEKKTSSADTNRRIAKNYLTDCKKLYAEARRMDSILLSQTEVDKVSARMALAAFTEFAVYCQSDTMAPVYLIKTAQVARVINNIPQAKLALDRCIDTYPAYKNRAAALFLLAQLYDEDTYLNDEAKARTIYEQILNEYPKSDWAISAKGAIGFLGKTDEQIMMELKKKK